MMCKTILRLAILVVCNLGSNCFLCEFLQAQRDVRFNRDVLPVIADHCFPCHGVDAGSRQADLRLDRREVATSVLPSGATAIAAGNLAKSAMWMRVNSEDPAQRMPPMDAGKQLAPSQLDILRRWIEQGAEYEPHWAFIAPQRVEPPTISDAKHPIDRFIRGQLQSLSLKPSSQANRETLIRRLTLDLTGLLPTTLEVDAFVSDVRPDAYDRVVRRLLDSEHFGERWARWWLDLAHYGDSDGYLQDFLRPVAWRYRQWVVEAMNRDMPFDQFTLEQIAGDLIPNATVSQRMATGFFRNTLSNREGGAELEEYRVQQVLDRTATLGTTWLGLTIGCAQCHDHKFDPVLQRDFYQFYAFFNNADEANLDAPLPGELLNYQSSKKELDRKRDELLAPIREALDQLQAEWEAKILYTESHPNEDFAWDRTLELLGLQWGQSLGEGQLEGLNIIKTPVDQRTPDQCDRLLDYFLKAPPAEYNDKFNSLKLSDLRAKLDALAKSLPAITRAPGMVQSARHRQTFVHIRGDFRRPGDEVQPATPNFLPPMSTSMAPDRMQLARWVVANENPLTARVVVNRLWQELFGRGIVATSDNFGVRGDRPSHPELLDWLALEFQQNGWSIKSILRTIVASHAYRQSSAIRPELAERDPLNRWIARQSRLRLSAESIRDCALDSSGLLTRHLGGPSARPPQPESVSKEGYKNVWETSRGADRYRRGLYTFLQRTSPYAQLVTFDFPDASRSCTRRERSNTPIQALHLLNDTVFMEAAAALADRSHRSGATDKARLDVAFLRTLGRRPTDHEQIRLLRYLDEQRTKFAQDSSSAKELSEAWSTDVEPAWFMLASVLLNLDEFIHRE